MFFRELVGSLRECVFGFMNKKVLLDWLKNVLMDCLIYLDGDWGEIKWSDKLKFCK